jgi:hypothetical protein
MRVLRFAFVVAVCSASLTPTLAQQTGSSPLPATTSDPQAVTAIKNSLSALVGLSNVTDVTLTGNASWIAGSDNESGTVTLMATARGNSEIDLNLSRGRHVESRNPASSSSSAGSVLTGPTGAWLGPDGVAHAMTNANVLSDSDWFFPSLCLGSA